MRHLVLATALLFTLPFAARAQWGDPSAWGFGSGSSSYEVRDPSVGWAQGMTVAGVAIGGALAAVFVMADFAYLAQEQTLPRGWAIAQLVVGGIAAVVGATMLLVDPGYDQTTLDIAGSVTSGLAAWWIGHAIGSLVIGPPAPSVTIAVQPTASGATFVAAGRF